MTLQRSTASGGKNSARRDGLHRAGNPSYSRNRCTGAD
jgi:hypothetical protein